MKSIQPALILGLGAASVVVSLLLSWRWHSIVLSAVGAIVGANAWFMGAKAIPAMRKTEISVSDRIIVAVGYSFAVVGTIVGLAITLMFLLNAAF